MRSEADKLGSGEIRRVAIAMVAWLGAVAALPAQTVSPIAAVHGVNWRNYSTGAGVTIEGVVTEAATEPYGFSIQDATAGIYIGTDTSDRLMRVAVGDRVRVTGIAGAGEFAPIIEANSIVREGRAPLPKPHLVTESEVSGGALDNLFVEIRGTVRAVARGNGDSDPPQAAFLMMDMQDLSSDSVQVVLTNVGEDPIRYVDAAVSARGVVSVIYNKKRQALGLKVLVDSPRDLKVLRSPASGPFDIGLTPIGHLMKWDANRDWSHRVRVAGTLTLVRPGEYVVLQDGEDAIQVNSESREKLRPGMRVEATGFISASEYSTSLRNAVIRTLGKGDAVAPVRRWPKQLLTGAEADRLVTTSATVLETGRVAGRTVLTLEDDGIQFEAEAPASAAAELRLIEPGARVEITGVCHITADALRKPKSLEMLARSAEDIRILSSGRAFTIQRIEWAGGTVGGAALLSVLWALTLRRRVREQTRWIQSSLDREQRSARMMAERSAILACVGRNEPLESVLGEVARFAADHIPDCGTGIRVCIEGESLEIGHCQEITEAAATVAAASNSGRIRASLTLERSPASEQENEALQVCRECLLVAVEHRDLQDRLIEQSFSDPLTHLPNRRSLDERFRMALEEARREQESMAVFALDLDDFKEVNDMLGHAAGDAVLREMSQRFSSVMRRSDVLARVGGDEFLAVLPKIGGRAHAMEIADRLLAAASADIELNGIRLSPSVSIGAAFYPEDGDDPETLRNAADLRMYQHKMNSGKRARLKQPAPVAV